MQTVKVPFGERGDIARKLLFNSGYHALNYLASTMDYKSTCIVNYSRINFLVRQLSYGFANKIGAIDVNLA